MRLSTQSNTDLQRKEDAQEPLTCMSIADNIITFTVAHHTLAHARILVPTKTQQQQHSTAYSSARGVPRKCTSHSPKPLPSHSLQSLHTFTCPPTHRNTKNDSRGDSVRVVMAITVQKREILRQRNKTCLSTTKHVIQDHEISHLHNTSHR